MPEKKTIERARRDKREGKAPTTTALKREGTAAVSEKALSRHAKAARTKGPTDRSEAAQKAARTRARHKSVD